MKALQDRINPTVSYSKDALFLHELSCTQCPEVDVGFTTGDDVGAVAGVEIHSKNSLIGALKHNNTWLLSESRLCHMETLNLTHCSDKKYRL